MDRPTLMSTEKLCLKKDLIKSTSEFYCTQGIYRTSLTISALFCASSLYASLMILGYLAYAKIGYKTKYPTNMDNVEMESSV